MKMKNRYYKPSFNKLKSKQLIDLSKCVTRPEEYYHFATAFKDSWFMLPDGKKGTFIQYYGYDEEQDDIRYARMTNELLLSKLFAQVGIDSATYLPARKGESDGLFLIQPADKNEKRMTLLHGCSSLIEVFDKIDQYDAENKLVDKQLKEKLFKLMIVDILTMQQDRGGFMGNSSNLDFFMYRSKEPNKGYSLAPVINNEYAYNIGTYQGEKFIYSDADIKEYLETYWDGLPITSRPCKNQNQRIDELCKLAKGNSTLMNALNEVLDNFSVQTAYDQLKKDGINVSGNYKKFTIGVSEQIKQCFLEKINSLEKE